MSALLSHWQIWLIPAFTIASLSLTFVASVFTALGKTAPGWIGTVSGYIASAVHFMNGNVAAATAPAVPAPTSPSSS